MHLAYIHLMSNEVNMQVEAIYHKTASYQDQTGWYLVRLVPGELVAIPCEFLRSRLLREGYVKLPGQKMSLAAAQWQAAMQSVCDAYGANYKPVSHYQQLAKNIQEAS